MALQRHCGHSGEWRPSLAIAAGCRLPSNGGFLEPTRCYSYSFTAATCCAHIRLTWLLLHPANSAVRAIVWFAARNAMMR
jgi:hypothetical protein